MSLKNYEQLLKDITTDEELAEKLEKADQKFHKTGDKEAFAKAVSDMGYEMTEQDFSYSQKFQKINDEQLDDVSGGIFGLGDEDEEGHELWCLHAYWLLRNDTPHTCEKSPTKLHKFKFAGYDYWGWKYYNCIYCQASTQRRYPAWHQMTNVG